MEVIIEDRKIWIPNIGDTIYNIREMKDSYEYFSLAVRAVHIYEEGIMLTFEDFPLGRRMDSLSKWWFLNEEEAKYFCENNKPKSKIKKTKLFKELR